MSSHYIKGVMKNKIGTEVSEDCSGNECSESCLENDNEKEMQQNLLNVEEVETEKNHDTETDYEYEYVGSAHDDIEVSDDMADACKTYCRICYKVFTLTTMRYHTAKEHNLQITQYKQIYGNFSEDESLIIKMVYHKCHICGKIILLDHDRLGGHIKSSHNMKEKDYNALFMKLAPKKRQSTQQKNIQELDKEGDVKEQNPHIGLDEIGMKRKRAKVDFRRTNRIVTAPKEKSLSLLLKGQFSDNSVINKSKLKTVLKRKEKFSLNEIYSNDNDVKEENTDPNEDESPNSITVSQHVTNDTVSQHVTNDNWINSVKCRNDDLYCNGGPIVKEGWKICFEEQKLDGRKVMVAKYMSPNGKVYTRGPNGYHIPELINDNVK